MCCLCVQLVPALYWLSAVVILLIGSFCLLCEAGSYTVLWLFSARHLYCWFELHCLLPFLYSKLTVLFTVCAYWLVPALWWCVLHCCILPLFVWYFLVGKRFPEVPSWGGSLSVWWLVWVLVGAGWLGLFCGYWSFIDSQKILLGGMLDSSYKWLLMVNCL